MMWDAALTAPSLPDAPKPLKLQARKAPSSLMFFFLFGRSEERRVGKEC